MDEMSARRRTSEGDFYLFIVSLRECGLGMQRGGGPGAETRHLSMLHYLQCDDVNVDGCY